MLLELVLVASALQDRAPDPVCLADVRWAVETVQTVSRAIPTRSFALFSAVGNPSVCGGQLTISAAYFDAADELICAGHVSQVAVQRDVPQITHLEFRPTNLTEFVRWRNGARAPLRALPLTCTNAEGTTETQLGELDRAASLRVYATLFTRFGGMATAELRMLLRP